MATYPARIWGVTAGLSGFTGYIAQSFSHNKTAQTAQARDTKGALIDLADYDVGTEITMEALVTVESNGLDVGDKVNIDGIDALVTGINKNESNQDFQRATITLQQGNSDTVIHTLAEIQGN